MKKVLLASVAVAALVTTGGAQAGWIGDTVDVSWYYPDLSTLYLPQYNQQTLTVPGSGCIAGGSVICEIGYSVGASQITFTNVGIPSSFDPGTFNGPVFTDASRDPNITDVVLDPASNLSGIPSWTADTVSVNFESLSFPANAIAIFDITFGSPVPEPSSLVLLGLASPALA